MLKEVITSEVKTMKIGGGVITVTKKQVFPKLPIFQDKKEIKGREIVNELNSLKK